MNPYDWCVANKTVGGKQIMAVWYVNNLKIYYVNVDAVDAIIIHIRKKYGKEAELKIQ